MKLLYDQHLSPWLVKWFADIFPVAFHVQQLGLDKAADTEIWQYAKFEGYTIVTQDSDYDELSSIHGQPPKVIWITCADTSSQYIKHLLRTSQQQIEEFVDDPNEGVFELF